MIRYEAYLTARSYECDLYGHVNNATYLNYCEAARVEFLEYLGFDLLSLKNKGWLLPIVKIEINYKRPVFSGDQLIVTVHWKSRRHSSALFEQEVIKKNNGEIAAKVLVTWVATDLKNRPLSLPQELLDRVYEIFKELPPKE